MGVFAYRGIVAELLLRVEPRHEPRVDLGLRARVRDLRRAETDLVPQREHADAVRVAAVDVLLGERLGQRRVVRRDALRARGGVSSWPTIRKVAHAFWSEYRMV